jgi:adenylate cyclase
VRAIDIRRALHRRAARRGFPIRASVGIYTGEAVHRQGDFFGRSVVLSARIAEHAQGGEIVISPLVRELVAERGDIALRDAADAEFKRLDGRHRLFEVTWTPTTSPTLIDDTPAQSPRHDG